MRHGIALATAFALSAFALLGHGAEDKLDTQSLWEGAGGLILPLDGPTPVRIDLLEADFTAIAPPQRTLDDPRFAAEWEISTRMELTNGSDAPCKLTLGLPQRAAADPDEPPAIDHAVISLDHRRMRIERVDQPGPRIEGAPPLTIRHRVAIDFEPGQSRRVDTLFRVRAPYAADAVRFRFVTGGAALFAGGEIARSGFEWHFGDRVRLVEEGDRKTAWIAEPGDGVTSAFYDDGRKSRLRIEIEQLHAPPTLELAAGAVGLDGGPGGPILGQMLPLGSMSALELELARSTLLALYGRMFRDDAIRGVFEDRPWSDCNPAYRVAHGIAIEERTLDEFLARHECEASCEQDRARAVDPYGPAWDEPLCWYAQEHNLSLTRVTDPDIKRRVRSIERRRQQLAARPAATKSGADAPPAESGCRCRGAGRTDRPARSLLALVLSSFAGFDR